MRFELTNETRFELVASAKLRHRTIYESFGSRSTLRLIRPYWEFTKGVSSPPQCVYIPGYGGRGSFKVLSGISDLSLNLDLNEYPKWDSNPHCLDPKSSASCQLGYQGLLSKVELYLISVFTYCLLCISYSQ